MKQPGKWILAIVVGLLGLAVSGWAETAYVSDVIRIGIRSGPESEQKILAVIESGQPLEVIKPGEEWSLVQLSNGTEGYILARYLTAQPPARYRLDQLQEKNKALTAQAAQLLEENTRLKGENEKLSAAAAERETEVNAVRSEFEAFRNEAADFTALKSKVAGLNAELDQKQRTIAALEDQAADIFQISYLYWFLAGAGVLIVGLLMGLSVKKRQRRWSSLS
jgi:SH3 domain protein